MRTTVAMLVFLLLSATAFAAPPRVVSSQPENGTVGVPVDIGVIRVLFDQDMNTGSWTLWGSDRGELPPLEPIPETPFTNDRTLSIRIGTLLPGTTYAIRLNHSPRGKRGFRSATGEPLPDTVIAFRTAEGQDSSARDPLDPNPLPPPVKPARMDFGKVRPDPDRLWTVLVYLDGDNDIEWYANVTLNDLEARFPDRGVEIVVLFDRAKGYDEKVGNWTDTRAFRVRRGSSADTFESELIANLGELNMGSADTLAAFISAGLRTFPARRICLMLWDHGSGWSDSTVDLDAPGSKKSPDELTLLETRDGIARGLKGAGREKFDLLNFHMCLMGQVEIATEMMPFSDTMVASEAMIPCSVVPFGNLMTILSGQPDPRAAAAGMVEVYRQTYRAKKDEGSTASAVDLTRLPPLLDAIDAVAVRLTGVVDRAWPTLSRSLFFSENYMGRADYRMGAHATSSIDLIDALRRMRANMENFPAEEEYRQLERALDACLLDNYTGHRWRLSQGLAIYGPVRAEMLNSAYRQTAFAKRGPWLEFLDRVHVVQKQNMSLPEVKDIQLLDGQGRPTKEVVGMSGTHVKVTVSGRNILWVLAQQVKHVKEADVEGMAVMFRTFVVDQRYETRKREMASELVDMVMPIYNDGDNLIEKEVGGLGYRVTDGERLIEATIDYSNPGEMRLARVPAIYSHPTQGKFRCDIMFDVNWSRGAYIVGYTPVSGGGFMPKKFLPESDAEITLLYEVITEKDGLKLLPTATVKWGRGLSLIPVFEDPGRYGMVIAAESIEGSAGSKMVVWEQKSNPQFDDLVKRGGRFEPKDLYGEWDLLNGVMPEGATQLRFDKTDITARFGPDSENRKLTLYEFKSPTRDMPNGVVFVETRAAPCLIYFARDDRGEWQRNEMHIAFHLPSQGADQFLLKDVFMGKVYLLVRKGGVPRRQPPPPPEQQSPERQPPQREPAAPTGLVGTWRTADQGMVIVFGARDYKVYLAGSLADQGVYGVEGNVIRARTAKGTTEEVVFTLNGNQLTLTWRSSGTVIQFSRSR